MEHKQLFKRIEQTYPELNQEGCLKVYGNVLKCVERKHLVYILRSFCIFSSSVFNFLNILHII